MKNIYYICLLLVLAAFGVATPVNAIGDLNYQIELDLDVDTLTLRGKAKVSYLNPGPRELSSLYFKLDANTKSAMEIQEVKTSAGLVLPSRSYTYDYLEEKIEDPVLYEVFLPEPLKAGERIELNFHYLLRHLPRQQGAIYLIDDINQLGLGAWYPRLIPFRDGRWQIYERLPADYEVTARANRKLYVISPLAPVSINNTDRSYQYTVERAQELSLIYTPDLLLRSAEYDAIPIRFYYHSNLQKWSPMTLEIIQDAMKYFHKRYGSYSGKRLTVISIDDSPYPVIVADDLLILRNSFSPESDPDIVKRRLAEHIAYGLAQQYWGYRVGQDPNQLPWINQGLSLFAAQTYMQQKERRPFLLGEALMGEYLKAARQGWNTSLATSRLRLAHQPLDSFQALAQGKGYTLFKLLERMLGKQAMLQVENRLLQEYRNQALNPQHLKTVLQQVSGKDLDWFFGQWVQRGDTLDYAISSATQVRQASGVKVTIEVQKLGQVIMPVSVALRMENGETVFKLWDGTRSNERLVYDLKHPLKEVILDPSGSTPDMDRENNSFRVPRLP